MNLALQKRHEQLERWKQNEEADVESTQRAQQQTESDGNSSIQQINLKPPSDDSQRTSTRKNNNAIEESSTCSDTNNPSKSKRGKSRNGRFYDNLQVKFSNSTLFLTACTNGDVNECERLLNDKLVDIDVTTSDGLTGLHEAAICGNAQMVEWLIDHGANINCCDNEGWTPLHAAASLGQVKIVELLLECGADCTIVNCENLLAYDLARNEQVQSLIGDHLQGVDIDYLHSQEERAIEKDIERWIKTGHYDERSHPVTNATVLHVLAAKGHVKLMKQILESPILKKQINLEAKDNEGFTPLLAASFWSQKEIVELLIEHNADIFAQANNGYKISSIVSISSNHLRGDILQRLMVKNEVKMSPLSLVVKNCDREAASKFMVNLQFGRYSPMHLPLRVCSF